MLWANCIFSSVICLVGLAVIDKTEFFGFYKFPWAFRWNLSSLQLLLPPLCAVLHHSTLALCTWRWMTAAQNAAVMWFAGMALSAVDFILTCCSGGDWTCLGGGLCSSSLLFLAGCGMCWISENSVGSSGAYSPPVTALERRSDQHTYALLPCHKYFRCSYAKTALTISQAAAFCHAEQQVF